MRKIIGALIALVLAASPAHAEWHQARTEHFILMVDDTDEMARDFAAKLERFDAALRLLYGVEDDPEQALRPITIYALREDDFNKACGCPYVLGYYHADIDRSYLLSFYAPKVDVKAKTGQWSSQVVLLHEYSHHFMYSNYPVAYPLWFSEGFAEFNANATFEKDGSLIIGYPANYRAEGLRNGNSVSLRQMLDPEHIGYPDDITTIYSRGWLLTHMLTLRQDRSGQLAKYLTAINRGSSSLDAAAKAFGDLKKLDAELELYRKGKLAPPLRIPAGKPIAATVTAMPPGESAVLPLYIAIRNTEKTYRLRYAVPAEAIAKKYPGDALLQGQVAEMEYLAGRLDQADDAADRALALVPDLATALVVKGRVAVSRAATAKSTDPKVWTAARGWYLKANRLDPNAVMPLYLFHASFVAAKAKPSPGAVKALMRAAVLAPESNDVRMAVARQALADGDGPTAARALQSLAYAPHIARLKNLPLQALTLVEEGKLKEALAVLMPKGKDGDD